MVSIVVPNLRASLHTGPVFARRCFLVHGYLSSSIFRWRFEAWLKDGEADQASSRKPQVAS